MIERGIVRVERGDVSILPIPKEEQIGAQTISSADFWDTIAKRDPALPGTIQSFLAALEPLSVYPELKASLNIKADLPDRKKPINFGYITKNGQFWTNPVTWDVPEHIWRPYLDPLAGSSAETSFPVPRVMSPPTANQRRGSASFCHNIRKPSSRRSKPCYDP